MVLGLITRDFKQTFLAHYTTTYVSVIYWWRRNEIKWWLAKGRQCKNAVFICQKCRFRQSKTMFSSIKNIVLDFMSKAASPPHWRGGGGRRQPSGGGVDPSSQVPRVLF